MLTIDEITEYLGSESVAYEDFLISQEAILAESIEGYCGRVFAEDSYTQTFYRDDYRDVVKSLQLFHYPVKTVTSIVEGTTDLLSDVRIHKPTGTLTLPTGFFNSPIGFFNSDEKVTVVYEAGYAVIPAPVRSVLLSLIEERYNKKKSGVGLNFGSDVQSISIPGTISVAFDYSLQSNERKTAFGTLLGNYVNVLDNYRSNRVLGASGTISYVEPTV